MKKILSCLTLALIMSVVFVSCRKAEIGPQGPAGASGKDGVANLEVKYVTIKPEDWQYDDLYKQWYYQYKLDKTLTDSSLVTATLSTTNGFQALPYLDKVTKNNFNFSENVSIVNPYLEFQFSNESTPDLRPINQYKYKVSILPKK